MTRSFSRREFLETGSAAALGVALSGAVSSSSSAANKSLRVGIVGTGNRGRSLMRTMLTMPDIEIPALCDIIPEHLAMASEVVTQSGRPKPEGYGKNEYSFKKLMEREDIDAVIIATYWQWHTQMAVYAMKCGKYTGVEVPAALSIEECWDLVNTYEETSVPCMMMENWSFRRDNLAVLNMIRLGMLGDIVHCHCAHSHDCIDHWFFDGDGNDRWAAPFLEKYNRDQYPTHSLGPVLSWMDINCGDYIEHITATASASKGINAYFARQFGKDHPNAQTKWAQGDIVTTVMRTFGGKTINLDYDMQLPRPYDNRWLIQGTLGLYNEQREALYITGTSPEYHKWEPFAPYQDTYDHAWWRNMTAGGGHGGTDTLELTKFLEAVRNRTQTPVDVYDSVVMSCIVALSGESIASGSIPVQVPDFTRGKWKTNKPRFALDMGE